MHATLALQVAVHVVAADLDRRALDPGFFAWHQVYHFRAEFAGPGGIDTVFDGHDDRAAIRFHFVRDDWNRPMQRRFKLLRSDGGQRKAPDRRND